MSTGIQWTDETWNPVVGCTKVSQGCKNCYAKQIHDQRHKALLAGKPMAPQYAKPFEDVQLMPERLDQPLHWRKPRRVFVNSVSDLFHEDVPDAFLDKVFSVMAKAQRHTFQILTKRPERMRDYSLARLLGLPLPNVWLGVSVENQEQADIRIPLLLDTPAVVRFLSCEPLLGPVKLSQAWKDYLAGWDVHEAHSPYCHAPDDCASECPIAEQFQTERINWVIVGGESGAKARNCDIAWLRDIVSQCRVAGVPCFVKQVGAAVVIPFQGQSYYDGENFVDDHMLWLPDHSHGGDPVEWPDDLRVREFPAVAA